MKHINTIVAATAFLALTAGSAQAQFTLSEILSNPAPGTDNGQEGVEIRGPASASLTGWWFLAIEGDGTLGGVIDVRQDLSGSSTGTNGHLLIRDAGTVILPTPDGATNIVVFDWTPDIENGTNTYILGTGTPPAMGFDVDMDSDGAVDSGALAGFTVVDAVTILDSNAATAATYADDFGGFVTPPQAFVPEAIYRIYNADGTPCNWAGGDINGTNPGGPYDWVIGPNTFGGLFGGGLNLGSANIIIDSDSDGTADACDVGGPIGTPFCIGFANQDGTCPCVAGTNPGGGCGNESTGGDGAVLGASLLSGTAPSVLDDGDGTAQVQLDVTLAQPNKPSLFIQGDTIISPVVFYDGLRCVGGVLVRLNQQPPPAGDITDGIGSLTYPNAVHTQSIVTRCANLGFPIAGGDTRHYFVHHRVDPTPNNCIVNLSGNANTSNAFTIAWGP